MSTAIQTTKTTFDLSPQTLEQALTFSNYLADSDLVPKDFKGKPANCLIAMQWGAELGLKPLQAMQNLAIINGRPALWGDAVIAIVRGSPLCEYVIETDDGEKATCQVKRVGEPEQIRTFSMSDARAAGLAGKQGPWSSYPKRMRQMRARAFALRDVFPDVLRGMPVAEELWDTTKTTDMGTAEVVQPTEPAQKPEWDAEKWAQTMPNLVKGLGRGKTIEAALTWANGVARVTPEQEAELRAAAEKLNPTVIDIQATAPQGMSYAQVADAIHKSTDTDTLDMARGFIQAVAGADLQAELHQKAAQRLSEITQ